MKLFELTDPGSGFALKLLRVYLNLYFLKKIFKKNLVAQSRFCLFTVYSNIGFWHLGIFEFTKFCLGYAPKAPSAWTTFCPKNKTYKRHKGAA